MTGEWVLIWVLGGLVAAAWGLSPNRRRFRALTELLIWAAIWIAASMLALLALVAVAR